MGRSHRLLQSVSTVAILLSALALTVPSGAEADITISTGTTTNMSCSPSAPYVCTPTSNSAVLGVGDLANMLAQPGGTVELTTQWASGDAQNIKIENAFGWATGNTLTLYATTSVDVDQAVVLNGPAGLTITTNGGGTGGTLSFGASGEFNFSDSSSVVNINGTSYNVVCSINSDPNANCITDLAAAIALNPGGNYVLGQDDGGGDVTPTCSPIPTPFSGHFDELGNQIKGLKLKYTGGTGCSNLGLFASISGGTISNVKLTANVTCSSTVATDCVNVGTLAASLSSGAQILNGTISSGTVTVTTAAPVGAIGGLVGAGNSDNNTNNTISSSSNAATVTVTGPSGSLIQVGGLAGNAQNITGATDTGKVTATSVGAVGGLVGSSAGTISSSVGDAGVTYNITSALSSGANGAVGGLAGTATNISLSHADRVVTGNNATAGTCTGVPAIDVGGLVGQEVGGSISQSYFTDAGATSPDVSASCAGLVGGLAGEVTSGGTVANAYATNNGVSANADGGSTSEVGGLVGEISGCGVPSTTPCITYSYSVPTVGTSNGYAGGFIGYDDGTSGSLVDTYWDLAAGVSYGVGNNPNESGVTGEADSALKYPSALPPGFNSLNDDMSNGGNPIWGQNSVTNQKYPYLLGNH
jgi:hypothetical protein